jgi:hypothetical protein
MYDQGSQSDEDDDMLGGILGGTDTAEISHAGGELDDFRDDLKKEYRYVLLGRVWVHRVLKIFL